MSDLKKTTVNNFISPRKARYNADKHNNVDDIVKECMGQIQASSLQGKYYCDFSVPTIAKQGIIKKLEDYGYDVYVNITNDNVVSIRILW